MDNKKIVITGPPGTGKTTIKKVYFEMENPIELLEKSLEPTRGLSSSAYTLFNLELGLFDLAGQENNNWLFMKNNVFDYSNIILCIFDIRNSLKEIINFLFKISEIKKKKGLDNCRIIAFLHKVDLVNFLSVSKKIKSIRRFFKVKYPEGLQIDLYQTSITDDFFYQTFNIILKILTSFLQKNSLSVGKKEYGDVTTELSIIMKYNDLTYYTKQDLSQDFKLSSEETNFHLKRLKYLGFIEFEEQNPLLFHLTIRTIYFKSGIERKKRRMNDYNKDIELFYTFLNLCKINA